MGFKAPSLTSTQTFTALGLATVILSAGASFAVKNASEQTIFQVTNSGAIALPQLISCDSIDTTSTGMLICGSDDGLTQEEVEDYSGGMWTNNTETRASITYQDDDGTIDIVVDDMNDDDPEAEDVHWSDLTDDGTFTNTKYCTYDSVNSRIDCNSEGGAIAADSLDFSDFSDSMTLDNHTSIDMNVKNLYFGGATKDTSIMVIEDYNGYGDVIFNGMRNLNSDFGFRGSKEYYSLWVDGEGIIKFNTMDGGGSPVHYISASGTVFNNPGTATSDFRIKSDQWDYFFNADVSAGRIGIWDSTPSARLSVGEDLAVKGNAYVTDVLTVGDNILEDNDDWAMLQISSDFNNSGAVLVFADGGSDKYWFKYHEAPQGDNLELYGTGGVLLMSWENGNIYLPQLTSCSSLGTDSNGKIICN